VNEFPGGFLPPPKFGDLAGDRGVWRPEIRKIRFQSGKMIMNGTLRRSLDTSVQLTIDRGK
jgi:hypothetical protein